MPLVSAPPPLPPSARAEHRFDLLDTSLRLRLDPAARAISATAIHTLRTKGANARLVFDAGRMTIRSVRVGGKPAPFRYEGDVLAIPTRLPANTKTAVEIAYATRPEAGLYFIPASRAAPASVPAVYTQGEMEDTRYWIPTYDFPDDKATLRTEFDVPAGWSALGNGKLLGVRRGPDRWRWSWRLDQPVPTYLASLLAGPYSEVPDGAFKGKPVSIWVPNGLESWAKPTFGGTDRIVALYSRLTATDYPFAKYAQGAVADFIYGGMENASATTQSLLALFPPSAAGSRDGFGLAAHELAHQWFGDVVTTKDWSNIWLNEGWATFLPIFALRAVQGEDAYQVERARLLRSAAEAAGDRPMVRNDFRIPLEMFDGNAYAGGAARMTMLMRELGEPKFWAATRDYLARYRFANADTAGFFASFSRSTGADLRPFMRRWFFTPGVPRITIARTDEGWRVLQTTPGFTVELETRTVDSAGGGRRKTLRLEPDAPQTVPAAPGELLLADPGRFLLAAIEYPRDLTDDERSRLIRATDNAGARALLVADWYARLGSAVQLDLLEEERVSAIRRDMLGSTKDETTLVRLTGSQDATIAAAAAEGLGAAPRAAPTLARLGALARTAPDDGVRAIAFSSLLKLTNDPSLAEEGWEDDGYDAAMPEQALRWWTRNRPDRARSAALAYLEDGDRIPLLSLSLQTLGIVKDKPGERRAFDAIARHLNDPAISVRLAALAALGAYGDPKAAALVRPFLRSPSNFVRGAASGALARLGEG